MDPAMVMQVQMFTQLVASMPDEAVAMLRDLLTEELKSRG